jgi:hypothetical protein
VFCYLSLLTHQEGYDNTDIYIDEFRIEEIGDVFIEKDPRPANINLLHNPSFDRGFESWYTTLNNPNNISDLNCCLVRDSGNFWVRLELPGSDNPEYLNNTWIGIYQELVMYAGNMYQINAEIDRVVPDSTQYPTILNIYAYKPGSANSAPVWLGSVDYKFNKQDHHFYSQQIRSAETATYYVVIRVFGWGNGGNPFIVKAGNIQVKRIE